MEHAIETELKVLLTREEFDHLASFYQPLNFVRQHNYYYVSQDVSHYAFRIRTREDETLFTLKAKVNGETDEYEKILTVPLEQDQDVLDTLASFGQFPPFRVFGELITDRAMVVTEYAELCFDINSYNGITDYEIEYEVKKGHDYKKAFKAILKQAGITYRKNKLSKYVRCMKSLEKNNDQ